MSVFDWSTTASSNGNSDASINFAEGQAPSTVNDSARALMARIKHFINGLSGNVTMGGASNAYTLTSGESLSAYADGMIFGWQPNADSTGAVTLNVDAIGAKKVYLPDGVQAGSGDLDADSVYLVSYDSSLDSSSGGFKIMGLDNTPSGVYQPLDATLTALAGLSVSADEMIYATGADTFSVTSLTSFSRTLLDDASASAARTTLGLGTIATEAATSYAAVSGATFTGAVSITGGGLTVLPTTPTDLDSVSGAANNKFVPFISGFQPTNRPSGNYFGGIEIGTGASNYSSQLGFVAANADSPPWFRNNVSGTYGSWYELAPKRVQTSSETSGTLTSASANKQITATSGITIPASVFTAGDMIVIDGGGTARTITRGSGLTMYIGGTDSATGTLAANGVMGVRFRSATVCILSGDVS